MSAADKMRGRRIWMTTEARGADARAKRPTAPGPPAAARSVMPRRDTGPAGTTEKRPPPAKSKGSGHTACPFFQVSSAYSKQKRCFSYRTTLCVFLSSKRRRILFGIAESYRKSAPARAGRAEQAICVFYCSICIAISSSISTFTLLQILFSCNHHVEKTVLHA